MFKRLMLGVSVFGMLALAPPAMAQPQNCGPRDLLVAQLTKKYGEVPAAGGLRSASQMMEIWAAPETGSWTALVTTAEGISCILASGTHWHQEKIEAALKDVPS